MEFPIDQPVGKILPINEQTTTTDDYIFKTKHDWSGAICGDT